MCCAAAEHDAPILASIGLSLLHTYPKPIGLNMLHSFPKLIGLSVLHEACLMGSDTSLQAEERAEKEAQRQMEKDVKNREREEAKKMARYPIEDAEACPSSPIFPVVVIVVICC